MSIILDGTAGITTTGLLTGTNATIGNVSSSEIDALSSLGNVTPSRVIISNAAGKFVNSPTTLTEVGYLSGVTSAIQTQLNGKEPTISTGTTSQYWRGDKTWQTIDLSSYATLASPTFTGTASIQRLVNTLPAGTSMATVTSGNNIEIIQPTAGSDSYLCFHVSSDYATFFGLDGSNNTLSVGGWSYGAAKAPLMYSGSVTCPGSAPTYACRAWVNFNGTGTVTVRGSGNVSSITDNGTGQYTVNFTTAMPDANYSVSTCATSWNTADGGGAVFWIAGSGNGYSNPPTLMNSSQVRFVFGGSGATLYDPNVCTITIFR